ncbi:Tho complex subunit 7-domain-containing protein [Dactylonectria macrodidyma]|uniref:Tho complex subunit 7-domain-containing protein n=1 Tax=Dactylonectria macrodidyma TaxID=307937 RepID=A0A9P9FP83_9HYPO|nr:Tho complex subunit 7-domain-containing protein [Dactylonectria macrodidyma]
MATSWDLLDQEGEIELHKTRLLNVEEKPFKRITKRLNILSTLTLPTEAQNSHSTDSKSKLEQLKEDLTLDFAAFDSTITRLQFLHHANARERERYKDDQHRILAECQAVRANNAQLREQLEASQGTLAQRKKFDELAEKITSNRLLRPREDQIANLKKLEEECRELERESETYSETWRERREQFNKIMEEGMMLRRQIRDEKEEVDRREGMNEGDDDDAEPDKPGQTPRLEPSGNATPRPDRDSQSKADGNAGTPLPEGGRTPSRDTPGPDQLKLLPGALGSHSRSGSQAPSRDASPMPQNDDDKAESGEDVEMEDNETAQRVGEDGEATPRVIVDPPEGNNDSMEVDN